MCSFLDVELRGCVNSWCHFVFKFLVLKSVYMREENRPSSDV